MLGRLRDIPSNMSACGLHKDHPQNLLWICRGTCMLFSPSDNRMLIFDWWLIAIGTLMLCVKWWLNFTRKFFYIVPRKESYSTSFLKNLFILFSTREYRNGIIFTPYVPCIRIKNIDDKYPPFGLRFSRSSLNVLYKPQLSLFQIAIAWSVLSESE